VWLVVTVALWVVSSYQCKGAPWLFMGHALFHLTAAMLIVHAACLGVAMDAAGWEVDARFWPLIRPRAVAAAVVGQGQRVSQLSQLKIQIAKFAA
jgi:hypothetical protein